MDWHDERLESWSVSINIVLAAVALASRNEVRNIRVGDVASNFCEQDTDRCETTGDRENRTDLSAKLEEPAITMGG